MILESTHWRDAARTPRFYIMDAYAVFPFAIFLAHMSLQTFLIAVCCTAFFVALERFKFTIPVFRRWLRVTLAGPIGTAKPWWRK